MILDYFDILIFLFINFASNKVIVNLLVIMIGNITITDIPIHLFLLIFLNKYLIEVMQKINIQIPSHN